MTLIMNMLHPVKVIARRPQTDRADSGRLCRAARNGRIAAVQSAYGSLATVRNKALSASRLRTTTP